MPYKRQPIDVCAGTWPAGPFAADGEPGEQIAAQAAARVAAAITKRREARDWSRAVLAERAGVGPHTVGRIEAGRAWPDLATIARLGRALNLDLTLAPPAPPKPPPSDRDTVEAAAAQLRRSAERPPLKVDLDMLSDVTAAHVIEAILHNSPRLAGQVEDLKRQRSRKAAGGRPW